MFLYPTSLANADYISIFNPRYVVEDSIHGFNQIGSNPLLLTAFLLLLFSIAFFNFAGITITTLMNATSRLVMDSVILSF